MIYFISIVMSLILLAFVVIFIASGVFSKQKYLDPWKKSYSQKLNDPRLKLVSHGLLALTVIICNHGRLSLKVKMFFIYL